MHAYTHSHIHVYKYIHYIYTVYLPSSGATLNSRTLSMETHWILSIVAMSQDVCVLDWSLKVSVPQPQNFLNVPTTFDLLFSPKQQLSYEKIWCLALIEIYFLPTCPGICRNMFDLCMWQIVSYCSGRRNSSKFFLIMKFHLF